MPPDVAPAPLAMNAGACSVAAHRLIEAGGGEGLAGDGLAMTVEGCEDRIGGREV
jgi:hypothetical protein